MPETYFFFWMDFFFQKFFVSEPYVFPTQSFSVVLLKSARLWAPRSLRYALLQPSHHGIQSLAGKDVGEREGKITAHPAGIPIHD